MLDKCSILYTSLAPVNIESRPLDYEHVAALASVHNPLIDFVVLLCSVDHTNHVMLLKPEGGGQC